MAAGAGMITVHATEPGHHWVDSRPAGASVPEYPVVSAWSIQYAACVCVHCCLFPHVHMMHDMCATQWCVRHPNILQIKTCQPHNPVSVTCLLFLLLFFHPSISPSPSLPSVHPCRSLKQAQYLSARKIIGRSAACNTPVFPSVHPGRFSSVSSH